MMAGPSELTIWAVSDGRAGIAAQAEGLAQAIARRRAAEVVCKHVGYRAGVGKLPARLNLLPRAALTEASGIALPWPDLWIAAGRATLPLSVRVARWSQGKTFVVQVQDPRLPSHLFDLVIPPEHDRLRGDNVYPIVGSPHRVSAERLAQDAAAFAAMIEPLPHPRAAVLIGGKSKAFDLSPARAADIGRRIRGAVEAAGGSMMLTFSRRTPQAAKAAIRQALEGAPAVIWDGDGPNPYFAFLGAADAILVTEDSTNMAAEAASTGKPVYVLAMDGASDKFARFHRQLEARGASRPFEGKLESWAYPPLDETDRAAVEVLRRFDRRGAAKNRR